ncbi:DUF3488 and transglutaminase-like domain-containing protein [Aeromicrobium sp.]|uniref:transglutaminase TgpA family protein n=1 Tax=Aeromicrobium sp. TaxID=1871063 RepID=UPI0019936EAE|nr:DUF3488 and transglutaminase-like domain-containing protein [Aeromicrobium sp.]MBC7632558.1 hypothetical protein [Aeromicrobium sp.]
MWRAEKSTRRAARRTTRSTWFDHGIIALAFAILLSGSRTVIEGSDWWITTLLVAILSGLTCAVLRGLGVRWVVPIAVVGEFFALIWIFVPTTLLVFLPTPDTFRTLSSLVSSAQNIVADEQAPVAAAKPIVLMIAASFGLLVIVADALLERQRAALTVGVLLVAVFVTPSLISGTTPSGWLFVSVAALWLLILRTRTSSADQTAMRDRVPAMALGAAALAAAVAFPVVSPDISAVAASWGKPPSAVFGSGINPMLKLGQNLRRTSPVTALTYSTSLDSPPYLKVATLRNFTGKTWRPSKANGFVTSEGEMGVNRNIKVDRARTTITIKQLRSSMLPVPYPALSDVSGLKGSWQWQRLGMTLESRTDGSRGQKYTVSSLDIRPTATQMRQLTTNVGLPLRPYVELPAAMPAIIGDTARKVTAGATNDYDRAIALQSYLRDGDFTYSETAPVADGYDGNGVAVIAKFLKAKAGYCVHFSSAMAVMARSVGIPSRIAVGYAPGAFLRITGGRAEYEATSEGLHAWTGLYFAGGGWTKFEPTPGVGTATRFDEPSSGSANTDSGGATTSDRQQTPRDAKRLDSVAPVKTPSTSQTAPRTALITIGGILVLGAAPGLLRAARRRWRFRRGRSSPDPLWRELEDSARDLGVVTSATDTPRGFAARLQGRPGTDSEALAKLLRRVETSRFSRNGLQEGDGVADLRAVLASLPSDATRPERLRAAVLPRSLAGRGRYASTTRLGSTATLAS